MPRRWVSISQHGRETYLDLCDSEFRAHIIGTTLFSLVYMLLSGATWYMVFLAYKILKAGKKTGPVNRVVGFANGLGSNGNGVHSGSTSDLINGAATGF